MRSEPALALALARACPWAVAGSPSIAKAYVLQAIIIETR